MIAALNADQDPFFKRRVHIIQASEKMSTVGRMIPLTNKRNIEKKREIREPEHIFAILTKTTRLNKMPILFVKLIKILLPLDSLD